MLYTTNSIIRRDSNSFLRCHFYHNTITSGYSSRACLFFEKHNLISLYQILKIKERESNQVQNRLQLQNAHGKIQNDGVENTKLRSQIIFRTQWHKLRDVKKYPPGIYNSRDIYICREKRKSERMRITGCRWTEKMYRKSCGLKPFCLSLRQLYSNFSEFPPFCYFLKVYNNKFNNILLL